MRHYFQSNGKGVVCLGKAVVQLNLEKQDRIPGYPSRVEVGKGSDAIGKSSFCEEAVMQKLPKTASLKRKSVTE